LTVGRRDMIESDSPFGETQRDLIQRRRFTFTVSPQSDQLANFRHPRHFRDQLVLDGQGWTAGSIAALEFATKSCGITCTSACGLPPLGDDANYGDNPWLHPDDERCGRPKERASARTALRPLVSELPTGGVPGEGLPAEVLALWVRKSPNC
jgi:hypothetical protein